MNPLESLLSPVARLLNKNIAESTPARELCAELDGKVVAIRVRDTALAMYFTMADGEVTLAPESEADADVVIEGSLFTLARLALGGGEAAAREGGIGISGDAMTAQQFQKLLAFAKPDIEEELSGIVGDTAAHQVGEFMRGMARWGEATARTMQENVREYLQEECRDVPSRSEFERFSDDVDTIRDDVERLEARIRRLGGSAG